MWTNENRARYDRSRLRYPSDLTDNEWALISALIPPAKRGGNKRSVDERQIVNGLMFILSTGCQWASLPKDLPPRSTVNDYFRRWDYDGTLDRIQHALYVSPNYSAAPLAIAPTDNPNALPAGPYNFYQRLYNAAGTEVGFQIFDPAFLKIKR